MTTPQLTEPCRRILHVLARASVPWTAREVAQACGEHRRASDWARGYLVFFRRQGLVETAGIGPFNAACWRITDAGRAAIASELRP